MTLSLREMLHISSAADQTEITRVCNEYYALYLNVYKNSRDPQVRDLAREKIEALELAARAESVPLSYDAICGTTPQTAPAGGVEDILAKSKGQLPQSSARAVSALLSKMPESAERYYLQGAFLLKTMAYTPPTAVEKVADCFARACELDTGNLGYRSVAEKMQQEINAYNKRLEEWKRIKKQQIEDEQNAKKRRARREAAWEGTKTVGGVIAIIFGGILTVVGGILSCLCECFD